MLMKSDFYFGALLSRLMKTGSVPAIIENGSKRRIYQLDNDYGQFKLYTKYAAKPANSNKRQRWQFAFSDEELKELELLSHKDYQFIAAFICAEEGLKDSKVVFITYEQLLNTIGATFKVENRHISVVLENGSWNFNVYGTGVDLDSAIKVTRNVENRLTELGFMKEKVV